MRIEDFQYERVSPVATYAPWLEDAEFAAAREYIGDNTLVDHLRLFELWQLVAQASKHQGDILEVGVWRGGTGCLMAKRLQLLGSSAKVFLCDTFTGVVKASDKDASYSGGEHADTTREGVLELGKRMELSNIELMAGIFPDDTGHWIADREFSLCHIDVDVYDSAQDVLKWVWPRMRVGGIVVYDDYGFDTCSGITRLVNETFGLAGCLTIHNLNGHAVVVKTRI